MNVQWFCGDFTVFEPHKSAWAIKLIVGGADKGFGCGKWGLKPAKRRRIGPTNGCLAHVSE
jgi:hypothetical protein